MDSQENIINKINWVDYNIEYHRKKKIGTFYIYYRNMFNVNYIENYNNNGELHGKQYSYYVKNRLREEYNYENGKLNGLYKTYNRQGKLLSIITYKDNEIIDSINYN